MRVKENQKIGAKAIKIAYGGLLTALGILLPQVFHIFGQNAGMMFLPIQIPVFLAGILLGPAYGLVVGIVVPALSCIFTAMPPVPKVYFMIFELGTYGFAAGAMAKKKCNVYLTLVVAMIAGRAVYGASLIGGVKLFHMSAPFMNQAAFLSGIATGIPGVVIQLAVIPILYFALKKGGFTFER